MAVPKRKTPRSKRDSRRANHDKITAPSITRCTNCGESTRPHRVCPSCGFYGGEQVIAKSSGTDSAPQS